MGIRMLDSNFWVVIEITGASNIPAKPITQMRCRKEAEVLFCNRKYNITIPIKNREDLRIQEFDRNKASIMVYYRFLFSFAQLISLARLALFLTISSIGNS